jgi:anti-sigma B factor antagonist
MPGFNPCNGLAHPLIRHSFASFRLAWLRSSATDAMNLDTDFSGPYCSIRGPAVGRHLLYRMDAMADADTSPSVALSDFKDIRIVEFTNSKILDEGNINDIGASINSIVDEKANPKVLLDFANVDHLSSAALGMLINVNNKIRAKNGQLRLANIKPQIFEVFVITKLNKLFRIAPNRPDALASFA